ncbi:MAG TPA: hypothetical protein ENK72_01580, partial [Epsilonproteobacteria bacterium]|nr:hypothetical protein [Campylobacterota bacterium]
MSKIGANSNTFEVTKGFWKRYLSVPVFDTLNDPEKSHKTSLLAGLIIALLGSLFIYLNHYGIDFRLLHTLLALLTFFLLLQYNRKVWFWAGTGIGVFWFWWIALSFEHYQMTWAMPFVILALGIGYGTLFWLIAYLPEKTVSTLQTHRPNLLPAPCSLLPLMVKSILLLTISYLHPLGFDWFKPELLLIESYFGIEKWQFAILLFTLTLVLWKRTLLFLPLLLFAVEYRTPLAPVMPEGVKIVTTHTSVADKWNKSLQPEQYEKLLDAIDTAIQEGNRLVILPESVFVTFLNYEPDLIEKLQQKAEKITNVTGGLYLDGRTPRNSTYIFTRDRIKVANKVVLVPFGESNPRPDFLSDWVNEIFYDGAVDYLASS